MMPHDAHASGDTTQRTAGPTAGFWQTQLGGGGGCYISSRSEGLKLIWVVVSNILYFHPYLGKGFQFDEHIFQMG